MLPSICTVNYIYTNIHGNNLLTSNHDTSTVADTSVSIHYLQEEDIECATNTVKNANGRRVILPTAINIKATEQALLPLSEQLSLAAQTAHILPALKSTPLLSMGKLCDNECAVVFQKRLLYVFKDAPRMDHFLKSQHPIMKVERNFQTGLWNISM